MIESISVPELQEALAGEEPPILVDCRELSEWDAGHIEGAIHHPLSAIEADGPVPASLEESAPIVFQCRKGGRSLRACRYFAAKGFRRLYNLEGGILAWIEAGGETTSW